MGSDSGRWGWAIFLMKGLTCTSETSCFCFWSLPSPLSRWTFCWHLPGRLLTRQVYDLFGVSAQSDGFWLWLLNIGTKLTIYLPLYAVALGPLVVASTACYLQQGNSLWGSVQPALRRLLGLFFCFLLAGVLLDLGLGLCFVGWPIAASLLLFTPQAFLLEKRGPIKSLGRSSALVNGYGGRVFACLLMLGVILWVVGMGIKLPLVYLFQIALSIGPHASSSGGDAMQQVVTLLSGGLTHLLLFPLLVSVLTALYYDLRIRKEGYDIDLLARELGYPSLSSAGPYLPPAPVFQPFRPGSSPMPMKRGQRGPRP